MKTPASPSRNAIRPAWLHAQRQAAYWHSLARALQAEQLTDHGRAAMQRLEVEIERFAGRGVVHCLPAVAVECTAELVSNFGNIPALQLGDGNFMVLRFHGDEAGTAVDGDHNGGGHCKTPYDKVLQSVAQATHRSTTCTR